MAGKPWPTMVRSPALAQDAIDHLRPRFFEGLAHSDVRLILAAASFRRLPAKAIVSNQGDSADYLFLLARGYARTFYITPEGRKIILIWFAPGEIFGGNSLLDTPRSYLLGTEVVKDSALYVWTGAKIRGLMARYPKLGHNALSLASDYLTWFLGAHVALLCDTAHERLAHILVTLAQGIGHKVRGGLELEITNEQLANAANITVFTASRLLSQWQKDGAVVKGRGKILLRSAERLRLRQV